MVINIHQLVLLWVDDVLVSQAINPINTDPKQFEHWTALELIIAIMLVNELVI